MNATWKKVVGDLKDAPARMTLVALAVFVGTVAMGTATGVRVILSREVESSFAATNPPSATLWLDRADAAAVAEARRFTGVLDAEPWRVGRARVEVAPGEWRPLRLFAVRDFHGVRVSRFFPAGGDWPPQGGEVLVEQSALPVLRAGVGDSIRVRLPGNRSAELRVSGGVHDPGQAPGWMDQVAYAYCTPDTLQRLGLGGEAEELRVTTEGDRDRATSVAAGLADRLREQGREVHRVEVTLREHPHADHMGSMLTVLLVFSGLALVLSGAMAANVAAALMAKQVRQIGVMKTLGATSTQVSSVYLRLVLLLAVAAVVVALPVAGMLSGRAATVLAGHLNLRVADPSLPWWVWPAGAALGVGVPVAVTALVVRRGAKLPAREAVSQSGVRPPSGRTRAWLIGGWAADCVLALSLRNTFRRPSRLVLSVGTLALGGAVVMTAMNVYASLTAGLDATLAAQGHDIDVRLLRPVPRDALVHKAADIQGVTGVEAWGMVLVNIERPGGSSAAGTGRYALFAPPADTRFMRVPVVAGRWPHPDEADAVVANRTLADKESAVRLYSTVTLMVDGRRRTFRVVGVVEEIAPPTLYTSDAALAALTGRAGAAGALRVTTAPGAERTVAAGLEDVLADQGAMPVLLMTRDEFRASLLDHFQVIVVCLLAAGAAAVVVGGLSVVTGTGINVLERSREIGVARSLGATRWAVRRMLLTEGIALAVLSVVAGVLLALPASAVLTRLIGDIGPHVTLPVVVSPSAVGGWAVVAAGITLTACLLAARRAVSLPVREVLAYE